jgi:hypothetical protein
MGRPHGAGRSPRPQASQALIKGLCEEAPSFFDEGVKLRVDTTEAGKKKRKGPLVKSCP